jgi:hypothetical protein
VFLHLVLRDDSGHIQNTRRHDNRTLLLRNHLLLRFSSAGLLEMNQAGYGLSLWEVISNRANHPGLNVPVHELWIHSIVRSIQYVLYRMEVHFVLLRSTNHKRCWIIPLRRSIVGREDHALLKLGWYSSKRPVNEHRSLLLLQHVRSTECAQPSKRFRFWEALS